MNLYFLKKKNENIWESMQVEMLEWKTHGHRFVCKNNWNVVFKNLFCDLVSIPKNNSNI